MAEENDVINSLLVSLLQKDKKSPKKPDWKQRLILSPLQAGFGVGLSSVLEAVTSAKLDLPERIFYQALNIVTYFL
jgi:hypothetical protein